MIFRTLLGGTACCTVALAMAGASAGTPPAPGVKIIHVPHILAREVLPDPPADESAAAGWVSGSGSLPRIVRLRKPDTFLDPIRLLPAIKPMLDGLLHFPQ